MKNLIIISLFFAMACTKTEGETRKLDFSGNYRKTKISENYYLYEIQFTSNKDKASKIIGEEVKDKYYPICCKVLKKDNGSILFNFRKSTEEENPEPPLVIGPGPAPIINTFIKFTESYEN